MSATVDHLDKGALRGVELRSLLLVRYGFRCCWCGGALAAAEPDCCVEHLVPVARGGPEKLLENLSVAHVCCNEARGCLPISDFVLLNEMRGRRQNRPAITRALHELALVAPTEVARLYAARELRCMELDGTERKAA